MRRDIHRCEIPMGVRMILTGLGETPGMFITDAKPILMPA
jgi:hypothetical protein